MDFYHVLNRGADARPIIVDDKDRMRFVHNLYEMNNDRPVYNMSRYAGLPHIGRQVEGRQVERKPLVQIHGWCLMDNHYHLLLSEIIEDGMSKFLKKLNMGYSKYFNERHQTFGTRFQGKTKRILINSERHYLYILLYIHSNPLDFLKGATQWRDGKIARHLKPVEWLQSYRWSSFRNYSGEIEFSKIISGSEFFDDRDNHVQELQRYLESLKETVPSGMTEWLE